MSWGIYQRQIESYAFIENAFNNEEINNIIQLSEELEKKKAEIYALEENKKIDDLRKTEICWIYPNNKSEWLYRKITDQIIHINNKFFGFDLDEIEPLQFSIYEEGDFYDKHRDHYPQSFKNPRKLSFVLQMTDPETYEGGNTLLWLGAEPMTISKKKGTITFFPSFTLHEVTKITKGTRHALVGWVEGKPFR